jgi:hypothetical protein
MENNSDFLVVPEYVHWSMLDFNIDMRGEIAMLSRNIKIRGEMQNGCPSSNRNCAILHCQRKTKDNKCNKLTFT